MAILTQNKKIKNTIGTFLKLIISFDFKFPNSGS